MDSKLNMGMASAASGSSISPRNDSELSKDHNEPPLLAYLVLVPSFLMLFAVFGAKAYFHLDRIAVLYLVLGILFFIISLPFIIIGLLAAVKVCRILWPVALVAIALKLIF